MAQVDQKADKKNKAKLHDEIIKRHEHVLIRKCYNT